MLTVKLQANVKIIGVPEPSECRAALEAVLELLISELGYEQDSRHLPGDYTDLCDAEAHIKKLIELL